MFNTIYDSCNLSKFEKVLEVKKPKSERPNIAVVYHGNCNDGMMAAAVVRNEYRFKATVQYFAKEYNKLFDFGDFIPDMIVYADMSPIGNDEIDYIAKMVTDHGSLVVIMDHHNDHRVELYPTLVDRLGADIYFNNNYSGCMIAAMILKNFRNYNITNSNRLIYCDNKYYDSIQYCIPELVKCVGMRDLWKDIGDTATRVYKIIQGLMQAATQNELIETLADCVDFTIIKFSNLFAEFETVFYDATLANSFKVIRTDKGHDEPYNIAIGFIPYGFTSDIAHKIISGDFSHFTNIDVVLIANINILLDEVKLSIRSKAGGNFAVNDIICELFPTCAGGGHRSASGGSVYTEDFFTVVNELVGAKVS